MASDISGRQAQAKVLRTTRKIHRWSGLTLLLFFVVVGVTSVLLGWKKNSGYLMPETSTGSSTELSEWLPTHRLAEIARSTLRDSLDSTYPDDLDRIDYRPGKGSLKFTFEGSFAEVQLDGATGKVLSVGIRRADFIESVHDGSAIDGLLGLKGDPFKIFYSTVMGLALLVFTTSGFWLWYGPKRMRK